MRTEQLTEGQAWALGDEVVTQGSGRAIRARADFNAPAVRLASAGSWKLDVVPSAPPVRHGLIIGWPPAAERDARKNLAMQIRAAGIQLRVR